MPMAKRRHLYPLNNFKNKLFFCNYSMDKDRIPTLYDTTLISLESVVGGVIFATATVVGDVLCRNIQAQAKDKDWPISSDAVGILAMIIFAIVTITIAHYMMTSLTIKKIFVKSKWDAFSGL